MFFKKIFILIVALVNINWQEMEYKILNWQTANDLKDSKNAILVLHPDFNLSSIYRLSDSSYLVMPLNPFGNSIVTSDKLLLDKWISEKRFPNIDAANKFYFENKGIIDSLSANKESLKQELCNHVFKGRKNAISDLTEDDIDSIYHTLKKGKKINRYKLNFIVLVGDFLLSKYNKEKCQWGLLKSKELINPIVSLILITDANENYFFNIEDEIFGKWGYTGIRDILQALVSHKQRPNELTEIEKVR